MPLMELRSAQIVLPCVTKGDFAAERGTFMSTSGSNSRTCQ